MTSEELEQSLKAEFESYLNGSFDAVRKEFADFQKNLDAEFAKHRSQIDEAVRSMAARLEANGELDRGFLESVTEHLRLSRDEGAKLTATAFSEAEKLGPAVGGESRLDAINAALDDISSRKTQADILGALVEHASQFAPRGVFFIVRHDQLTAWKSFGEEIGNGSQPTDSVRVPVSADTILANAVNSLATQHAEGSGAGENGFFLEALGLGTPQQMYAIPLKARGRGVAVLYADLGRDGVAINIDALEMMVRVAGLTVELRAAGQQAAAPAPAHEVKAEPAIVEQPLQPEAAEPVSDAHPVPEFEPVQEVQAEPVSEPEVVQEVHAEAEQIEHVEEVHEVEEASEEPEVYDVSEVEAESEESHYDLQPAAEPEPVHEPVAEPEHAVPAYSNGNGHHVEAAPAAAAAASAGRTSGRNIDLPIEVSDEERKYHTNARRFARLLVSEIKLYNEQRVQEGLQSSDLYDRLREAIDRSREMYEKRVEPQVAARFDYFHYELLNDLAGGDAAKLGSSYPGAAV